jgi:hypothetical protein
MEDLSVWSADDLVVDQFTSEKPVASIHLENDSAASSTALLATATQDRSRSRNNLSASLATTSSASNVEAHKALTDRLKDRVSPEIIRSGGDIPPELLLNGARAIGAFCRPYASATVGTPVSMEFDIRTSRFQLSVEVAAGTSRSAEVYTEIFVPFVHYAQDGKAMSIDVAGTREADGPVQSKVRHDAKKGVSGNTSSGLALDISVDISEGRFETTGQYLRWWYDSNATKSRTVTIKIRRKGGAITARMEQSIPSWSDLCPVGRESCLIM